VTGSPSSEEEYVSQHQPVTAKIKIKAVWFAVELRAGERCGQRENENTRGEYLSDHAICFNPKTAFLVEVATQDAKRPRPGFPF